MTLWLLTFWILHGLVNRQDQASGFSCCCECTLLHNHWLPDVVLVCVFDCAIDAVKDTYENYIR